MSDQRFRARKIRLGVGRRGASVDELGLCRKARSPLREQHRMGAGKIRWQGVKGRYHKVTESDSSPPSKIKSSPHRGWTPSFLRISPIDPGEQITELGRGDRHRAVGSRGPQKAAPFQALVTQLRMQAWLSLRRSLCV
jgi:hypothetical protein